MSLTSTPILGDGHYHLPGFCSRRPSGLLEPVSGPAATLEALSPSSDGLLPGSLCSMPAGHSSSPRGRHSPGVAYGFLCWGYFPSSPLRLLPSAPSCPGSQQTSCLTPDYCLKHPSTILSVRLQFLDKASSPRAGSGSSLMFPHTRPHSDLLRKRLSMTQ